MRYIGSKNKILPFINNTITKTYGSISNAVVADLFSGTACVAELFKSLGARVITNDYMEFSYAFQTAKIKLNNVPDCNFKYDDALRTLNELNGIDGFFFENYTAEGTESKTHRRNYFSASNARKIDAIRQKIGYWRTEGMINEDMFYLLVSDLVDAVTKVSNTSGTYGAFLKIDDARKHKALKLVPSLFQSNGKENQCYCSDIFEIIDQVKGDILYLDPPYNSRQYPPYYHILETVVKYDNPAIYGVTGRRPYAEHLSPLCVKDEALLSLLNIVDRAHFSHIYISYSTDGIVDYKELCDKLKSFGDVDCFYQPHRRYKSNSSGTEKKKLKEIIIYVKKR